MLSLIVRFLISWLSRGSICLSTLPFEDLSEEDKCIVKYVDENNINPKDLFLPKQRNEQAFPGDVYKVSNGVIVSDGTELKGYTVDKSLKTVHSVKDITKQKIRSPGNELCIGYSTDEQGRKVKESIEGYNNLDSDLRKEILYSMEKDSLYYKNRLRDILKSKMGIKYDENKLDNLYNDKYKELIDLYDTGDKQTFDNLVFKFLINKEPRWTIDLNRQFLVKDLNLGAKPKGIGQMNDYTTLRGRFDQARNKSDIFIKHISKFLIKKK